MKIKASHTIKNVQKGVEPKPELLKGAFARFKVGIVIS